MNVMQQLSDQHHHRHWHYVYHARKRRANSEPKEIIAGQATTVFMSVFAGAVLDDYKISIAAMAGALIVMPGLVDLSASIAGALAAKINHRLELGEKQHIAVANSLLFAVVTNILAAVIVGFVGVGIALLFFDVVWYKIILLTLMTSCMVGVIVYPLVAYLVIILRKRGLNPDNLAGPIQSSVVDVAAILAIAFSVGVLS